MKANILLTVAALGGSLFTAKQSHAYQCGRSPLSAWNVPKGAVVVSRSLGPILTVMDSIGEWGTHSVLSHGDAVSHSTAADPSTQNSCSHPLGASSLLKSQPGAERITVPAAYIYYFGTPLCNQSACAMTDKVGFVPTRDSGSSSDPAFKSVLTYEWYSGNNPSDDYLASWINPSGTFVPGGSNWGDQIQRAILLDPTDTRTRNETVALPHGGFGVVGSASFQKYYVPFDKNSMFYGYHQYIDIGQINYGLTDDKSGVVCSTFLSYAQARGSGTDGLFVPAKDYTGIATSDAAHALWNRIFDECNRKVNWFQSIFCSSFDACTAAANQVLNAFVTSTDSTGYDWVASLDAAHTISPDCIAGWSCPAFGKGASVWGWSAPNTVQWSSDGDTFACWN